MFFNVQLLGLFSLRQIELLIFPVLFSFYCYHPSDWQWRLALKWPAMCCSVALLSFGGWKLVYYLLINACTIMLVSLLKLLDLLLVAEQLEVIMIILIVGDMAQWLGRWSLAGRLSPDLSLTGDHFLGKLSTVGQPTGPTQPSMFPGH